MRTIADLDAKGFLVQSNKIRKAITGPLAELDILGILSSNPIDTSNLSEDEKKAKAYEQAKLNIDRLFDVMLEEKPEVTERLIRLLVIPDEGEELTGGAILKAITRLMREPDIIDFFTSLIR